MARRFFVAVWKKYDDRDFAHVSFYSTLVTVESQRYENAVLSDAYMEMMMPKWWAKDCEDNDWPKEDIYDEDGEILDTGFEYMWAHEIELSESDVGIKSRFCNLDSFIDADIFRVDQLFLGKSSENLAAPS